MARKTKEELWEEKAMAKARAIAYDSCEPEEDICQLLNQIRNLRSRLTKERATILAEHFAEAYAHEPEELVILLTDLFLRITRKDGETYEKEMAQMRTI